MKVSVLQEDLLHALTSVSRFVSPRAQLPVLANILFTCEKGKLRLAATNLEMGISLQMGAKVEKEGALTVPAKMVVDLVSSLPPGRVQIEQEGGHLRFLAEGFSSSLAGIPANEFPAIPQQAKGGALTISYSTLEELSRKVTFAASTDEARPVLTGALLIFGENKLAAVATDGFRLSHKEFQLGRKEKKEEQVLVPARAVEELARILQGEEEIKIFFLEKEGQILFSGGPVVLTGRLIEGEFPNYEKIIPNNPGHKALVDKEGFLRAVRAAAVFAKESASILKLKLEDGKMFVEAESQQYGQERATIDAKVEGGELEMAFNYRYVLDFLGSADGDEVLFATDGPTSPALFQDTKDPSYKHLIMPVRIQS